MLFHHLFDPTVILICVLLPMTKSNIGDYKEIDRQVGRECDRGRDMIKDRQIDDRQMMDE